MACSPVVEFVSGRPLIESGNDSVVGWLIVPLKYAQAIAPVISKAPVTINPIGKIRFILEIILFRALFHKR
jgi:hypothetical protein